MVIDNAGNEAKAYEENEENPEQNVTTLKAADPKVGDFTVNYSVTKLMAYDKWRILNFDNNGHMEIVCYNTVQNTLDATTTLAHLKSTYANFISVLNTKSQDFKNGTYGFKARHLGSNPTNPSLHETVPFKLYKILFNFIRRT